MPLSQKNVPDPKPTKNKKKSSLKDNPYLKYSGMAFQMAATILVFVFLGQWLDKQFNSEPLLLIVGCLLGVGGGIYLAIKDFL
ncbi:MAG: AtpZ/AtpI family protein [Bacteroidota bacterium]